MKFVLALLLATSFARETNSQFVPQENTYIQFIPQDVFNGQDDVSFEEMFEVAPLDSSYNRFEEKELAQHMKFERVNNSVFTEPEQAIIRQEPVRKQPIKQLVQQKIAKKVVQPRKDLSMDEMLESDLQEARGVDYQFTDYIDKLAKQASFDDFGDQFHEQGHQFTQQGSLDEPKEDRTATLIDYKMYANSLPKPTGSVNNPIIQEPTEEQTLNEETGNVPDTTAEKAAAKAAPKAAPKSLMQSSNFDEPKDDFNDYRQWVDGQQRQNEEHHNIGPNIGTGTNPLFPAGDLVQHPVRPSPPQEHSHNNIMLDGVEMNMDSFYSDEDFTNLQTDVETDVQLSNQEKLENIMRYQI